MVPLSAFEKGTLMLTIKLYCSYHVVACMQSDAWQPAYFTCM